MTQSSRHSIHTSKTKQYCEELVRENPTYQYTKTFERHLGDLNTLDPTLYRFNDKLADLYITILQTFKHSKGVKANTPILLEPWQKAAIGIAFGWERKNKKDRWVRRFNTVLFFMARKQGKSLLSAALSLTDSLIRTQYGSEIAMIATKTDQAKLVWDEIHGMINKHPDLKKKYRKVGNKLFSKIDAGTIYPLGRDSKTLDGLNISIIVADEVHAMANSDLIDVCKSSQGAREQPLLIYISTAGFNLASPLVPEVEYSRKILDGKIEDETYFAFLAEPKKDDDRYSIDTLKKSNPNMDVSVSAEFLEKEMQDAKTRPEKRTNYLTKYLNIFVNASEEFINIKDWQACTFEDNPAFDPKANPKAIYVGCDLSTSDDLTAIVTAWVDYEDNMYIETEVFLPEERIEELSKRYRAPLAEWVKAGQLQTTKGGVIDYDEIYTILQKKTQLLPDLEIYYDAYKFRAIKSKLENVDGFKDAYPVNQGFLTLNEPLSLMATYIRSHKITHKNNPVMNWCMSNVKVQTDTYGSIKIDKSSHYEKIDPVAALGNIFYGLIPKTGEEDGADEIIVF